LSYAAVAPRAREHLAREHALTVWRIAEHLARCLRSPVDIDDLVSEGFLGLLAAGERFEPGRGVSFQAYASLRIRGAMIDALWRDGVLPRRVSPRRRVEDARALTCALLGRAPGRAELAAAARLAPRDVDAHIRALERADPLALDRPRVSGAARPGPSPPDRLLPSDAAAARAWRAWLCEALRALPLREQVALRMRYLAGRSDREIAARLGVSPARAGAISRRGLARLAWSAEDLSAAPPPPA